MKKIVCSQCGSSDVQMLAWIDANTYKFKGFQSDITEEDDCYCENCKSHQSLEESDEDLENLPVVETSDSGNEIKNLIEQLLDSIEDEEKENWLQCWYEENSEEIDESKPLNIKKVYDPDFYPDHNYHIIRRIRELINHTQNFCSDSSASEDAPHKKVILKKIYDHITKNDGRWDFCNDNGAPMTHIQIGEEKFPVKDLAVDSDGRPCFLVSLERTSQSKLQEILNCM